MGGFDRAKAYAPQGDVFLDDWREVQLLHYVCVWPDVDELRGSPAQVLAAVDEFARTCKYLMNVGEHKGAVVDVLFLDQNKLAYLPELRLCERLGLLRTGSVVVADNVIRPGNPPYLAYVRTSPAEKKRAAADDAATAFPDAWTRQYARRETNDTLDLRAPGDPILVYARRLVESFEPKGEPDGVEITTCVGREP